MPNRFTTAYAGSGTITPENAKFHLDQFLPEDPEPGVSALGLVLVPEHVARRQAGLKHVIAWLDGELGKDAVLRASKLVEALLDRREYEENGETYTDDLVLVMLYDPDSEEDVALAKQANDAGIRVVDLCAAGDDLLLENTDLSPAEESVADQALAAAVDEPAEETPPWDENPAARAIRQATADGVAAALVAKEAAVAAAEAADLGQANDAQATVTNPAVSDRGVTIAFHLSQESVSALARAIVAEMTGPAIAAVSVAPAAEETVASDAPLGQPAEGDPAPAGTRPYYYSSESGLYRPARGKARDKERKVYLAEAEVREITQAKLLA